MEFGLKWVHMARYEVILRLVRGLWLTIIFKPPLTPKGATKIKNRPTNYVFSPGDDTTKLWALSPIHPWWGYWYKVDGLTTRLALFLHVLFLVWQAERPEVA